MFSESSSTAVVENTTYAYGISEYTQDAVELRYSKLRYSKLPSI